jgi:hypothetical protein
MNVDYFDRVSEFVQPPWIHYSRQYEKMVLAQNANYSLIRKRGL